MVQRSRFFHEHGVETVTSPLASPRLSPHPEKRNQGTAKIGSAVCDTSIARTATVRVLVADIGR